MRKPLFGVMFASVAGLALLSGPVSAQVYAQDRDRAHGGDHGRDRGQDQGRPGSDHRYDRDHDRPPTERERAAIERVLRSSGYTSWQKIERDDNRWEVDDARARRGGTYDLKLDARTLRIVERKRDDSPSSERPLTARERASVERVLRSNGYVGWRSIERDKGRFEVDDARTRNGARYDLKLDARSYRIVERERDR